MIAAPVVLLAVVVLAHPHQEEYRVIDREAEDDPEDHRRPDRVHIRVAAQRPAVGDVEQDREDAEGDADGGEVEADRDRRQRQRAEDQDQDQEGREGDRGDHDRDPIARHPAVVVEDRRAAGDAGDQARFAAETFGVLLELLVEGDRARPS